MQKSILTEYYSKSQIDIEWEKNRRINHFSIHLFQHLVKYVLLVKEKRESFYLIIRFACFHNEYQKKNKNGYLFFDPKIEFRGVDFSECNMKDKNKWIIH